ncbi:MAG: TetR/AcrR family transcriptional regulator [Candidatus Dormibacteraeota bacterium]|nr:TetR/AcrR family transcriptional regulator [Candidatus Dormibacteraeota bacterium]
MATSTSNGETTEKSIREAAVKAIAKHGFEAASLREIAKDVGIRAPSLYNYISSKEQLLYELMKDPLTSMLTEYRALVKEIDDPAEKLRVFVQVHLGFHLRSRLDVFIGNMELRSLSAGHYRTISNLREEYARALQGVIEDGVKSGVFHADEPRVITLIMLGMLSGVCNWYQPGGPMSATEMTELHTELAFRMLGATAEPTSNAKPARKRPSR